MKNSRYPNPVKRTDVNRKVNPRSQFVRGGLFSAGMVTGSTVVSKTLDELLPEDPEHLDASVEEADLDVFSIFDLLG